MFTEVVAPSLPVQAREPLFRVDVENDVPANPAEPEPNRKKMRNRKRKTGNGKPAN
jgi:hypothetical protein